MAQKKIEIRELKETLSSYLAAVQRGTDFIITENREPVARLVPIEGEIQNKVQQMLSSGMASWSGQRPSADTPRVPRQGSRMVSDLLTVDRR
jgi:prevent-host-death family protein